MFSRYPNDANRENHRRLLVGSDFNCIDHRENRFTGFPKPCFPLKRIKIRETKESTVCFFRFIHLIYFVFVLSFDVEFSSSAEARAVEIHRVMGDDLSSVAGILRRLGQLGANESDLNAVRGCFTDPKPSSSSSTTTRRTSTAADGFTISPKSPVDLAGERKPIVTGYASSSLPPFSERHSPSVLVSSKGESYDDLMSFLKNEFSKDAEIDDGAQKNPQGRNIPPNFRPAMTYAESVLDSWLDFDVFHFSKQVETDGYGVLAAMGELIFQRHNFPELFRIPNKTLWSFLRQLELGYHKELPYHNAIHAADVTQSMSCFMTTCGLKNKGDGLLHFAAIVAALGHDVGHPGYTNRYLIFSRNPIAITYNDKSPLENMHASTLFSIMWGISPQCSPVPPTTCRSNGNSTSGKCDIVANLDKKDQARFRKYVIELVLATDNGVHEHVMDTLKTDPENHENIYRAAIHAADLGGSGKTSKLSKEWANRVLDEFYRQGDQEKAMGISVLPVMNRNNPTPRGVFQEGFIRTICMPIYMALNAVPGIDVDFQIERLEKNATHWVAETENRSRASLKSARSFTLAKTKSDETFSYDFTSGLQSPKSGHALGRSGMTVAGGGGSSLRKHGTEATGGIIDGHQRGSLFVPVRRVATDEFAGVYRGKVNSSPRNVVVDGDLKHEQWLLQQQRKTSRDDLSHISREPSPHGNRHEAFAFNSATKKTGSKSDLSMRRSDLLVTALRDNVLDAVKTKVKVEKEEYATEPCEEYFETSGDDDAAAAEDGMAADDADASLAEYNRSRSWVERNRSWKMQQSRNRDAAQGVVDEDDGSATKSSTAKGSLRRKGVSTSSQGEFDKGGLRGGS